MATNKTCLGQGNHVQITLFCDPVYSELINGDLLLFWLIQFVLHGFLKEINFTKYSTDPIQNQRHVYMTAMESLNTIDKYNGIC